MNSQSHTYPELAKRDLSLSDSSSATAIIICTTIFTALATISVAGRFIAVRVMDRKPHADDWLIIPALMVQYGQFAMTVYSVVVGGVGYHVWTLSQYNLTQYLESSTLKVYFITVSLGLSKISICLFLIRMFHPKKFWLNAYLALAYQIGWTIACVLTTSLLCRPFRYSWDKSLDGTCGNTTAALIAISVLDVLGDLMLILLPSRTIWQLQISFQKKIGLSIIFSLGLVDIACAILRIVYIKRIDIKGDYTYQSTQTTIWSGLEPPLAVIVACSPTLHPLLRLTGKYISTKAKSLFSKYMHSSRASSAVNIIPHNNPVAIVQQHESFAGIYPELSNFDRWLASQAIDQQGS